MKAAIIILSDPKSGTEEAAGRAFNALSTAYDFKQHKVDVRILFQGTGTRWAGVLTREDHPFYGLYQSVKDKVQGASCGCAAAFGATEDVEAAGITKLTDNAVPGTTGLPSAVGLLNEGYTIMTF